MKKILYVIVAALCLAACEKNGPTDPVKKSEYVDLGLTSGTKWNTVNETKSSDKDGLYRYDDAISLFGDNLPTNAQWEELQEECTWTWIDSTGYEIVGPNGNSIILHAAGYNNGKVGIYTGTRGGYWSAIPTISSVETSGRIFFYLLFNSNGVSKDTDDSGAYHLSVRLVENPQ